MPAQKKPSIKSDIKRTVKSSIRKSAKKHPVIWILIILAIVITIFIITPVENPIKVSLVFDSVSEQLAIFKECPAWFFNTWKTEGHLTGWDARVALSSFERAMLA